MLYLLIYYWIGIINCILQLTIFEYGPIAKWLSKRLTIAFKKLGLNTYKEDMDLETSDILFCVFLWPIYMMAEIIFIIVGKED